MSKSITCAGLSFAVGLILVFLPNEASACDRFALPELFSINQSTGIPVTVRISETDGTNVAGSVKWGIPPDSGDRGELTEGVFNGDSLSFTAIWRNSPLARYEGELTSSGRLSGTVRWGTNNQATFRSIQKFACAD